MMDDSFDSTVVSISDTKNTHPDENLCGDDKENIGMTNIPCTKHSKKRKVLANSSIEVDEDTPKKSKRIQKKVMSPFSDSSVYETSFLSSTALGNTVMDTVCSPTLDTSEDAIDQLSAQVNRKELLQDDLLRTFEGSAKALLEKLEYHRKDLDDNRIERNHKMSRFLKKKVSEKENLLRGDYEEEMKKLKLEKEEMEHNLQDELSLVMAEQKVAHEQMVKKHQQDMEVIIQQHKSAQEECKQLKHTVDELTKAVSQKDIELQEQVELVKCMEVSIKKDAIEAIEDELTCIICQELFLSAITLPCAHSFCEICLRTWFKTKKTCPVCRRNVEIKALPSVVLDSTVDRIVEMMDEETGRKRMQLKRERNEQKRREDVLADPHGIRKMIYYVGNAQPSIAAASLTTNRRRSRSQSPASRVQQVRQRANQNPRALTGAGNIPGSQVLQAATNNPIVPAVNNTYNNNHNYNNNRMNVNAAQFVSNHNQRNNGYQPYSNYCVICGRHGHVSRNCWRR